MAERRFTEKEVARVLRRASEIQSQGGSSSGATETEIRAAAQEIGIDPQALARAMAELDGGPLDRASSTKFEQEAVIHGRMTDEAWEDTVAELRRHFGEEGTVGVRSGVWEWTGTGGGLFTTHVGVRQDGDVVRVIGWSRSEGLMSMFGALAFIPFFIMVAVLSRAPLPIAGRVMVVLGVILGLIGLVRLLHARTAYAGNQKLVASIRRIQERIARPPIPVTTSSEEEQAAPQQILG